MEFNFIDYAVLNKMKIKGYLQRSIPFRIPYINNCIVLQKDLYHF